MSFEFFFLMLLFIKKKSLTFFAHIVQLFLQKEVGIEDWWIWFDGFSTSLISQYFCVCNNITAMPSEANKSEQP